jgi:hypothetical protein
VPKVPLTSANKATNNYEFPKLFLEKGERALIVCIEQVPHMEYVHTLRKPQIIDGVTQTETDQKGNKQTKYDFVGRHICVGNEDVIAQKGLDAKGCPVCAESVKSDMVKPPERRFARHVIRYKTQMGSFKPQDPFQVELIVWAFGDKIFNQLVDFAEEWGDLRQHDLKLGPCEVKNFQKFEINVAATAAWLANDEYKQLVTATYKNNQIQDLSVACGRRIGRDLVKEDLEKVLTAYRIASGKPAESLPVEEVSSQLDVSDILADEPKQDAIKEESPSQPPHEVEANKAAQADAEEKQDKPPADEDVLDLDDILNMA